MDVTGEPRTDAARSDQPLVWVLERLQEGGPLTIGLLVAAAGLLADQATKALAVRNLHLGEVIEFPGPLYFSLTFNEGAAFGIPAPWWVFLVVTGLVFYLVVRNLPRAVSAVEPIAYGLLLAGALGNVTDRLLRPDPDGFARGEVVDFIASSFWPTFNIADVCITTGFLLLVVGAWRHERIVGGDD